MREILRQGAWWVLNKKLCEIVGLEPALLLSLLADKEHLLNIRKNDEEDYILEFTMTDKEIENKIFLSPYLIGQARKVLEKEELIHCERKGVPARNHYKIFWNKCEKIFITSNQKNGSTVTKIFGNYLYKELIVRILKKQATILKKLDREFGRDGITVDQRYIELLIEFMEHRRSKSISELSARNFLKNCQKHGYEKARKVLDYTIEGSYQGIFWDRKITSKAIRQTEEKEKIKAITKDEWKKKNKTLEG